MKIEKIKSIATLENNLNSSSQPTPQTIVISTKHSGCEFDNLLQDAIAATQISSTNGGNKNQ